jgi:hypothetical protein
MKTFNKIYNLVGALICLLILIIIVYNYLINHKEPSTFEIFIGLLLYMQYGMNVKNKDVY